MLLIPIICAPFSQNVIVNDDYLLLQFCKNPPNRNLSCSFAGSQYSSLDLTLFLNASIQIQMYSTQVSVQILKNQRQT